MLKSGPMRILIFSTQCRAVESRITNTNWNNKGNRLATKKVKRIHCDNIHVTAWTADRTIKS